MNDRDDELWRGGRWERTGDPPPDLPRVHVPAPPRPVLRPKKRRWSWRGPFALLCLALFAALTTVGLSYVFSRRPFYAPPWEDQSGRGGGSGIQEEEYNASPPSIPRAETGTGVTLELAPGTGEPLTYRQIYQQNLPCMVSVRAEDPTAYTTGTGVIFTEDGYVVTNAHIVAGAEEVSVVCSDNRVLEARLVGFDPEEDLAVLKVEARDLTPAQFGDSSALRCGDPVAAIGDPLGYRSTITDGIVSALDREVEVDGITMVLIQTTAAINFGNSGGALINQYGQVVGITTVKIVSDDGSVEGLGFAIPSQRVKYVVDTLIDGREVRTGVFGFTVYSAPAEGGGLRLKEVDPKSDAWAKGVRAGDVVTAVDGQPVSSSQDLIRLKLSRGPGDTLTLTCLREGEVYTAQVALVDEDSLDK